MVMKGRRRGMGETLEIINLACHTGHGSNEESRKRQTRNSFYLEVSSAIREFRQFALLIIVGNSCSSRATSCRSHHLPARVSG